MNSFIWRGFALLIGALVLAPAPAAHGLAYDLVYSNWTVNEEEVKVSNFTVVTRYFGTGNRTYLTVKSPGSVLFDDLVSNGSTLDLDDIRVEVFDLRVYSPPRRPDLEINQVFLRVYVKSPGDIAVTKRVDKDILTPGEETEVTITLALTRGPEMQYVVIEESIPRGVEVDVFPSGWAVVTVEDRVIKWRGALYLNESASLHYRLKAVEPGTYANVPMVYYADRNVTSNAPAIRVRDYPLAVTQSVRRSTLEIGERIEAELYLRNMERRYLKLRSLNLTLPAGVNVLELSEGLASEGGHLVLTDLTFGSGESMVYRYVIMGTREGNYSLPVAVETEVYQVVNTYDPPGSALNLVVVGPILEILIISSVERLAGNQTANVTVAVKNLGRRSAEGVDVSVLPPEGVVVRSGGLTSNVDIAPGETVEALSFSFAATGAERELLFNSTASVPTHGGVFTFSKELTLSYNPVYATKQPRGQDSSSARSAEKSFFQGTGGTIAVVIIAVGAFALLSLKVGGTGIWLIVFAFVVYSLTGDVGLILYVALIVFLAESGDDILKKVSGQGAKRARGSTKRRSSSYKYKYQGRTQGEQQRSRRQSRSPGDATFKGMGAAEARKILDVSENASQAEIKRAYRRLARKFHPDANPELNAEWINAEMQKINHAYKILTEKKVD